MRGQVRGKRTNERRAGAARRSLAHPGRRLLALALGASTVLAGVAAASGSTAPDGPYVGVAAGAPGMLTLSISGGTLTAFAGSTSRLVCTRSAHAQAGPYAFRWSRPVHLRSGGFAFTVSTTPAHSRAMVITVYGGKQAGNEVTGTITASLSDYQQSGNSCHAKTSFETVTADRRVSEHPTSDTFGRGFTGGTLGSFAGRAGFDYANHRVTQFNGAVDIVCHDGSRFPFLLDTAARGRDPLAVDQSGAFAISGLAPLAGRGDIVQYSLTGQIHGKLASGTLRAAVAILFPKIETCSSITGWSATAR